MFRALLALSLLALPGAVTAQRKSISEEDVARWAALLRIEDARIPDSAVVLRALQSREPAVEHAAMRTIGRNRIRSLYPFLRQLVALDSRDTIGTAEAIFALGLARDSAACPELERALRRKVVIGVSAAWSLGEIGGACHSVGDALRAASRGALRVPAPALAALLQASVAVKLADHTPLVALANARGAAPLVRWSAFWALARLRATTATRPALHWAARRDPLVAEQAVRLLASPLVSDPVLRDSARRVAALQLQRIQPHLRIAAARVVASYDSTGDGTELLALLRDEQDLNVRRVVSEGLAQHLSMGHAGWNAVWNRDTVWARRSVVLAEALRRDSATAHSVMIASIAGDPRLRAVLLERARERRGLDFSAISLAAALDSSWQVRARAINMIGSVARDSLTPEMHTVLANALADSDDDVREAAASALGRNGASADVALLIDAYRRETSNSSGVDVQLAILRALGGIHSRDASAVPDSLARSLELPTDLRTANAVSQLAAFAPAARAMQAPRFADSSYARIVREIAWPSVLGRGPTLAWDTPHGTIVARLHGDVAPLTVWNILALARDGYYRRTRFHRVVPGFVAQDGDPRGTGGGGPGYAIPDELNRHWYVRGAIGMALSGPDTGGSQYLFTLSPQPHLDGRYTVFGSVISGWDAMDALVEGDALLAVRRTP
jgi:cyclophilin family peptidyl-prolyl cis-trans isomerase